jgi:PKD repeat protein
VANAGADQTVDEGNLVNVLASFTDDAGDSHTATIDWGDGSPREDADVNETTETVSGSHVYGDNGTYVVTVTVTDNNLLPGSDIVTVTVNNVAPEVTFLTVTVDPVALGTPVEASATFTDPGSLDTHTAVWDWGNASPSDGTVGAGTVGPDTHTYTEAGLYPVMVTVTDDDGGAATAGPVYAVVYDAAAGFVTGGGNINSPAGACPSFCGDAVGKAIFAFVSRYEKGQSEPSGTTKFRFNAGHLAFESMSYDWLVVAGHRAMFKGVGEINDTGNYGFQLSAIDAELTPSTDTDLFRIRIWDIDDADAIVYDNQIGEDEDADPTTAIAGGSIKIHSGKNKKTDDVAELPTEYALRQNYPNPFNPTTTISYDLPEPSDVTLTVVDVLGRQVRVLASGAQPAGIYEVSLDASALPSGIYFYRLEAGDFADTKRMVVVK